MKLRIGTRGSALARRQVELAAEAMAAVTPTLEIETVVVRTEGDERQNVSLEAFGGQGVFVKALETRLLSGEIDLAVHSLKDVPAEMADGLVLGAVLPREDARDALVSREGHSLAGLPPHARIGSDSRRRGAQLLDMRPDLRIESIRGNVDTRLRKVDAGEYDGVMLAVAGLNRLDLSDKATQVFETDEIIPAPGQGAIAVQCRASDVDLVALLSQADDAATRVAVEAERAFLAVLGAGCQLPVGAHAVITNGSLHIHAILASASGHLHRGEETSKPSNARQAGEALGKRLRMEAGI